VPDGSVRLFAGAKRIWQVDGEPVAVLRRVAPPPGDATLLPPGRRAAPPPGDATLLPPGRVARRRSGSLTERLRGLAYSPPEHDRFLAAEDPTGATLFVLFRPPAPGYEPETAVLTPAGATRAVIRRVGQLPGRYTVIGPDGEHLGSIEQRDRAGARYSVHDSEGRAVGTVVAGGRAAFIVQLEEDTILRDAVLAFAVDAYRLRL
jgi:hypothetical protein